MNEYRFFRTKKPILAREFLYIENLVERYPETLPPIREKDGFWIFGIKTDDAVPLPRSIYTVPNKEGCEIYGKHCLVFRKMNNLRANVEERTKDLKRTIDQTIPAFA